MFDQPISDDMPLETGALSVPPVNKLRELMNTQPEMSQDRMAEILRKLNDGSYLTRNAAEESATRLLDDGDIQCNSL